MTVEPKYKEDSPNEPVRLEPFTKKNWKTAESRDEWKEHIGDMASAMSEAEWRSVASDKTDRKAAIIHVNNYNREKWLQRLSKHNLVYKDIRYSEPYDGFSHKHYPTDKNDLNRITYAVVAQNEDIAEQFKEAELNYDSKELHETVGSFLGFPECCRNHFNEKWVSEGKIDPMYEITCNSDNAEPIEGDRENLRVVDPNPGTNILWRYFGLAFITHIPCSWDCERSIEIARSRYEIMAENGYEEAANALYNWLSEPHVWTGYHGICEVRNQHMLGSSVTSSYWNKKRIVWDEKHNPGGHVP